MSPFTLKTKTAKFRASAAVVALIAGLSPLLITPAFAQDACVDGTGSNSLQCGDTSTATAFGATAIGDRSTAIGVNATTVGDFSDATGENSTALGKAAQATAEGAIAIGAGDDTPNGARASSAGNIAIGGAVGATNGANASSTDSISIGSGSNATGTGSPTALGTHASATGNSSTAVGTSANAAGITSTALGKSADAPALGSTAVGWSASAGGSSSTAVGRDADAAGRWSTALGLQATAVSEASISVGVYANISGTSGENSIALGYFSRSAGENAIAIGGDTLDNQQTGADAQGADSIVIGADASDAGFASTVLIGKGATATEADQVILKDADVFTILGNGEMGLGTASPSGTLDVDAGMNNSTLVLSQSGTTPVQWEIKNNEVTGRMTFGPLGGNVPLKFGSTAVNNLLRIGTVKNNRVDIGGDIVVLGTVTSGGPTCGGGCDAVFDPDYDLPSIEEHAAQMYANKHLPAVGPTIPHAPVNLSDQYGNLLNELEKAHIYIADLDRRNKVLTKEKRDMRSEMDETQSRLTRLEALLVK